MTVASSPSLRRTGNLYIARDVDDPSLIAIYEATDGGRHPRVATGFASREEAERWIKFHQGGGR